MIKIRKAQAKDLTRLIELEMIIIDEMGTNLYQELGLQRSQELILEASKSDPKGRYHYSRAIVATEKEQIVGLAYGFLGNEEKIVNLKLDALTEQKYKIKEKFFPDPEALKNEWYLDSLVVDPKWQNQGIGTALLNYLPKIAKDEGVNIIGLNVDDQNPLAKALYERKGFRSISRIKIGTHNYSHLQKFIK
ncbi:MAG: GNAT family N-acetyltransferase [Bombilactobacillus mellifer]|nr:GNAT family N-acetyltransferase [Bombilactobacillus mellifer]